MTSRYQIIVRGIVQGVGFRPFVYSRANSCSLKGRVLNDASGVLIDVEGNPDDIEQFVLELKANPPPLSSIESIECNNNLGLANFDSFSIEESQAPGAKFVPLSPDIATCNECLGELFDPHNRRYRYPFINCTNCGPRFTIIEDIPYDRRRTTMRDFMMCVECEAEYRDPLNRRFHAEPTACVNCGPVLTLLDDKGREVTASDPLESTRALIAEGKIVAVKGIGGFHLACDALNPQAVERLRQRKYREDKPFALMAGNLSMVKRFCEVTAAEAGLLLSEKRPIVLLHRKRDTHIAEAIAPTGNRLGFMLPYSPLHHLLLKNLDGPLVFTSGNVSDEPICFRNEDAIRGLHGLADGFLIHDRRIHLRSDDSVVRISTTGEMILRRSRGYAPAPILIDQKFERQILACGAELKNTFCLGRGHYAFVSQHIGDLENLETLKAFTDGIEHFKKLFYIEPKVVAYDLHPEYLSTKYALALEGDLIKIGVQHHHAHIASCLADNGVNRRVLGVAFDGLGFGLDGRLWGGEFLIADFFRAERVAHLDYVPMPGGSKAIREPWRMAATYLDRSLGDQFLQLNLPFIKSLDKRAWSALRKMAATGTNAPETSSIGRLFDAISSLVGIRNTVNYEGQAAIELEAVADKHESGSYSFEVSDDGSLIHADSLVRLVVEDLLANVPVKTISARFHNAVARLIKTVACNVRSSDESLGTVALSGGVFQNEFLVRKTCELLKADGFEVLTHHRVPCNDGGISLGQAVIANAQLGSRKE